MLGMLIAIVLTVIAGLHALWGARIWWPFGSEEDLVAGVVGGLDMFKAPSKVATFAVVVALLISAMWALILSGWVNAEILPDWIVSLGGAGIAVVFLGRGVFGLTPAFARMTPVEPFRTLDRKYYTPLCIVLGCGFAGLLIW